MTYLRPRLIHFARLIVGDHAQALCWQGPAAEGVTLPKRYWTEDRGRVGCFKCLERLRKDE